MTNASRIEPHWPLSRVELLLLLLANVNMVVWSLYAAVFCSPTFDEPAHFASGFILSSTGDPNYFKVNPPLNKWVTGLVAPLMTIELPPLVASAAYSNATRPEFDIGDTLLELNRASYLSALTIARIARIPFLLLGSWLLWQVLANYPPASRVLAVSFWCFSPLVLGHGWVVSADALAGVAMCFIMLVSKRLLEQPTLRTFSMSGLAWGLAIGTKFTFAPLVIPYIVIIELCLLVGVGQPTEQSSWKDRTGRWVVRLIGRWTVHAAVACLTVNCLYLFENTGSRLAQHDFISHEFSGLGRNAPAEASEAKPVTRAIAWLPSPFPKAFLEGIDQQLADMNSSRGAYMLGTRFPGKLPWFFVVGYWLKEQTAVPLAIVLILGSLLVRRIKHSPIQKEVNALRLQMFCILSLLSFCLLMMTQSNLVWNMRYLIPALPLVYALIPMWTPPLNFSSRLATKLGGLNTSCVVLFIVMFVECLSVAPFHFSYISPLVGGSYRVPIALNDSNVDYGQDLYFIAPWAKRFRGEDTAEPSLQLFGILSGRGRFWLEGLCPPATPAMIDSALSHARQRPNGRATPLKTAGKLLVVSRGLTHPEPWAVRGSTLHDQAFSLHSQGQLKELLRLPPDVFITPTIAVYYLPDDD